MAGDCRNLDVNIDNTAFNTKMDIIKQELKDIEKQIKELDIKIAKLEKDTIVLWGELEVKKWNIKHLSC